MPFVRKIPLVWSSPKAKEQTYTRYDPVSKRTVTVNCPCTVKK